jgi:alkylated DNA repair dioxygenase AlkB
MVDDLSWQSSFDDLQPWDGPSFEGLRRLQLDADSWVDHVPGWWARHGELFDELTRVAPWQQRERWMYEKKVAEPRLVAVWDDANADTLPPDVEQIRSLVSERYGVSFDSVLLNLYRDGSDSVAWHGDTVRKRLATPMVATVSLGQRRRFLLRRRETSTTAVRLSVGGGDLVVMGGRSQHDWEHTIPKESKVSGARISITMRHRHDASS